MKKHVKASTALFFLSIFVFAGCTSIKPSATITRQQIPVSGFNSIDISGTFTVYVNASGSESVEIEANENLHDYIVAEQKGNTLVIGLKDNVQLSDDATLKAYVSANQLRDYMASGASNIILEHTLTTDRVTINLSGASHFRGDLIIEKLKAELSGSASADLSGFVGEVKLDCSGASTLGNFDLTCRHLQATLSGASEVRCTVNEKLDIDASGSSTLYYKGMGKIGSQNLEGGSKVEMKADDVE